ncbi:MAG: Tim44 domain-containing protein [Betaproteobacteria bacterium]|nr:Tim44 domain-containing protein [Betaproteobacteria bacterium]
MKRFLSSMIAVFIGIGLTAGEAAAAKVGGGKNVGTQRNITNAPAATPPRTAQQAAPATPPAAAPQPQSALSRWAPMLGGLAIGGLLGSMFAGGGLGGAMGSILMMALLGVAAVFVIRLLMRGRAPQAASSAAPGMQYAGLGNETVAAPPPSQAAGFEAQPKALVANVPAGFDVEGFVRQAKLSYIRMQTANDSGNVAELREFTTPEMFESLKADVDARGGVKQFTDVVTLNADLLEVVTEGDKHWASVRFSGLVREVPGQAPASFEEIWNLGKPVDGSAGWLLAGIQQMH